MREPFGFSRPGMYHRRYKQWWGYRNKEFVFVPYRKNAMSEPEEAQYPAFCIMVEYFCAFPDIADIFHRIKNRRIFL